MARDVAADIRRIAEERILVLDGAWGVLLQNRGLTEEDFRGEQFASHPRDVKNNPDLLNLTRPDIVRSVHDAYFDAGADIATTNTFTATSIAQADYGLEASAYEMNVAGARIAGMRSKWAPKWRFSREPASSESSGSRSSSRARGRAST